MNDFTKEELEFLKNSVREHYKNNKPVKGSTYINIWSDMIKKIQSMIDKYCEHDPRDTKGAIGMYHCPECGDMQIAGFRHVRLKDDDQ